MIAETATVFRSINGRRYLSRSAAIVADCRCLMSRHYPGARAHHGDSGRMEDPGYYWPEDDRVTKIFDRLLRYAKHVHRKRRKDTP